MLLLLLFLLLVVATTALVSAPDAAVGCCCSPALHLLGTLTLFTREWQSKACNPVVIDLCIICWWCLYASMDRPQPACQPARPNRQTDSQIGALVVCSLMSFLVDSKDSESKARFHSAQV